MPVSVTTFEQLALEDGDHVWERVGGRPREKPGMTMEHDEVTRSLVRQLLIQVDSQAYTVDLNQAHLHIPGDDSYVPDVCVIPRADLRLHRLTRPRRLETYTDPLPFVAEVWSPSTGSYDVMTKLPDYQRRGDAEIWLLHPYDRTIVAWVRQPDGSYQEHTYTGAARVPLTALPGIIIDLSEVFAEV